jgi:hypothetical protein
MVRGLRLLGGAFGLLVGIMGGAFLDVMGKVAGVFTNLAKQAIDFDISITGLLEQAEKARRFFSELRDEMNYMSDKYGDTTHAVKMLTKAAGSSIVTQNSLKSIFSSLVDAGADVNQEMGGLSKEMNGLAVEIGLLELKTGIAGSQFSQMAVKFEQTFKRKGIEKEILKIKKAMMGLGLSTANLEQLMQGLTEATDKLAFATRGQTMDMKGFSMQYMETVGVLKKFGINAQTTTTFINNLLDPENIDKNMLLLNKLGYSYEQFNDMINSGKGSEVFFDKILNNIGDIAREANMIEDSKTRLDYLKNSLGLPPEIAGKLLNIEPYRMKEELKKLRKEMEEQQKEALYKQRLKAKEEKWQESMDMLRYEMVQPLVDLILKNRTAMKDFAQSMKPIIQGLASMLSQFLTPVSNWFSGFSKDLESFNNSIKGLSEDEKTKKLSEFIKNSVSGFFVAIGNAFISVWNSNEVQNTVIPIVKSIGDLLRIAVNYAIGSLTDEDMTWNKASEKIKTKDKKRYSEATKNKDLLKIFDPYDYDDGTRFTKFDEDEKTYEKDFLGFSGVKFKIPFYQKKFLTKQGELTEEIKQQKQKEAIQKLKTLIERENVDPKLAEDLAKAINESNFAEQKRLIELIGNNDSFKRTYGNKLLGYLKTYDQTPMDLTLDYFKTSDGRTFLDNQAPGSGLTKSGQSNFNRVTSNLSTESVASTFKQINANAELRKLFVDEFSKNALADLKNIKGELASKETRINNLQSEIKTLTTKIEEIGKNPVLTTLKEIQKGLFGDTMAGPNSAPIWSLLSDIKDVFFADTEKQTNKPSSGGQLSVQQVVNSGQEITSGGLIPDVGGTQYALNNTYLENINKLPSKNLVLKQTLYLRAIAESTFTSARYLKYIAGGFIFTVDGLQVIDHAAAFARSKARTAIDYAGAGKLDIMFGKGSPYSVMGGSILNKLPQ